MPNFAFAGVVFDKPAFFDHLFFRAEERGLRAVLRLPDADQVDSSLVAVGEPLDEEGDSLVDLLGGPPSLGGVRFRGGREVVIVPVGLDGDPESRRLLGVRLFDPQL